MGPGYRALRDGAAWLDLSARGRIAAGGEDRARLLHAMTTNHVLELTPGAGCRAFFLNPQGRILADAILFCRSDDFLIDVEPETRASLYQHLDRYIIADDVTLEDVSDSTAGLALEGPQALDLAASAGATVPVKAYSHTVWNGALAALASSTGAPGLRLIAPAAQKQEWIERLEKAGAVAASADEVRVARLEHFRPRYTEDIFDTTLSQETRQQDALHFSKGCYIGQEIVERVRSRGLVHRLLAGLEIDSPELPAPDTRIFHGEENIGKITSTVFSPALDKVVGLAYVRREFAEPGTVLTVNGAPATVRAPDGA